jgi:hypothetical protein
MHQHLAHQISFIKSTLKYVLIIHLFSIVNANIFVYKLGTKLEKFDLGQK